MAAGVAAVTSALPDPLPYRVAIGIAFVVLVTIANLRGAKESSNLFALPTYAFVTTVFTMIVDRIHRMRRRRLPAGSLASAADIEPRSAALSLFLILRAFASGSTALTGVEAIADGVQAFRPPKAKNAAATLMIMGAISVTMFLGISTLARLFQVRISEETVDTYGTVISQIGRAAFYGGVGFWLLQVFTAGHPLPGRQHRVPRLPPTFRNPGPAQVDASPVPKPRRPTGVLQRRPGSGTSRDPLDLDLRRPGEPA